jgi:hypothetical protein
VYVIVYSLRAGVNMSDIHRHLMNVVVRTRDAPILLVGTHSDVVGGDPSLPLAALKAKYPQVRTFCSATDVTPLLGHWCATCLSHFVLSPTDRQHV